MPQKKIKTKEELLILGSPIGELCQIELFEKKNRELENSWMSLTNWTPIMVFTS